MSSIYALYKGDNLLTIGTTAEIAEHLNVKENSVRFYRSKAYKERTSEENGRRLVLVEAWRLEPEKVNLERIRALQKEFGYKNSRQMAEVLNISQTAYSSKLRGELTFTREEVEMIADLFFVKLEELLND